MPKTCCFSTSIFSGFGLDFKRSWASKSAALLAAPGVLDPTAFYACINILHFLTRGGQGVPRPSHTEVETPLCWLIFRPRTSFFHFFAKIALTGGFHRKNCGFVAVRAIKNLLKSALGACHGLSWACLGLSWPVLGLSWAVLACLGSVLGPSWPVLGLS